MSILSIPALLGVLGLALLAAPASADPLGVAIDVQPLPTGCTGAGPADLDNDGVPEAYGACTTPPCGCNCPVVGAGVDLVARGQEVDAVVLAGCGYYLGYDVDPNDVDWDGPIVVQPQVHCYSGGAPEFCRFDVSWG
jgi:hypothetical protein